MSTPLPRAIQLVNSGQSVSLSEWAQIARACQTTLTRIELHDDAVDSAVALARLLQGQHLAARAPRHPLAEDVLRTATADVTGHVRGTLAMATHAARRGRLSAHVDTMLAGVESQALSPATDPTEISAMLAKWPNTLSATQPAGELHPAVALAITHIQAELLQQSIRLLDQVVGAPEVLDLERFRGQLLASLDAWRQARGDLKEQPATGFSGDQVKVARSVSVLSVELRDCLRTQSLVRPAARFDVLTRAEQAGNLRVAAMIAPVVADETIRGSLLAAAADLQTATSTILSNTRGDLVVDHTVEPAPTVTGPAQAVASAAKAVATSPEAGHRDRSPGEMTPAPDTAQLSPETTRELARRRDAGVLAAAALEGVPQATAMADGVSPVDLARLVEDGRQACGRLMASAVPLIHWRLTRRNVTDRQDPFASIAVDVAAAAHTWDPARAAWSTFVVNTADWSLAKYSRIASRQPIPVLMDAEADQAQPGALDSGLLADPGPTPDETATVAIDAARAAYLVSRLAYPGNVILQSFLGTAGAEPATFGEIADRLGMSQSTVSRRFYSSLTSVRSQMGAGRE